MDITGRTKSMVTVYIVYAIIITIALSQVVFALEAGPSLPLMLMLALLQASLAVMYFMHLSQEKPSLFYALIPYTVFVFFMMNMIWSDSFRLLHMRPH